ncbi:hypothetical protein [Sapientia aquatica]|nr:hypothetical protein [Sapientia aquatica]
MKKYLFSVVTVLIFGLFMQPFSSTAQSTSAKTFAIPSDLVDQINRSSAIGRQLFLFDHAAAIGTNILRENVDEKDRKHLRGYLPQQESDSSGNPTGNFVVLFFTNETVPRIAYEVEVAQSAKPIFRAFYPAKSTSELVGNLIRARQTAIDANPSYSQPINPIVLPGNLNNENGILVYLIAGTKVPNVAVFGKHFRALVESDGSAIKYMTPLSYSEIEIPIQHKDSQKTPVALSITQLVTDYPTETHVFTSLLIHFPVYVVTRRGIWLVNGDKISLIDDRVPGTGTH